MWSSVWSTSYTTGIGAWNDNVHNFCLPTHSSIITMAIEEHLSAGSQEGAFPLRTPISPQDPLGAPRACISLAFSGPVFLFLRL